MKYLFIVVMLVLVSCGKEEAAKTLFSRWTHTTQGTILELSNSSFGSNSITWLFVDGAICTSTLQISGDADSGTYTLSGSAYASGGGGDPGCASLDSTGTFGLSAGTLCVMPLSTGTCAYYN